MPDPNDRTLKAFQIGDAIAIPLVSQPELRRGYSLTKQIPAERDARRADRKRERQNKKRGRK